MHAVENRDQLEFVTHRIDRLSIEDIEVPQEPSEQTRPSQNFLKWTIISLESVGPDEVGKTVTRSSYQARQGVEATQEQY